ncbi:MAG: hypothetical protein JWM36_3182 [Hyphomicrobiales bacterium]|nr:hypothetical protein [Hyphomicrobiales bacterium]
MAINDVLKAAAAADDYDSARVIAAFMNAEAMKESAMGRDPAGWTDTRVLALGRMFAEVFREQRGAPAPVARPVMPTAQPVFEPEQRVVPIAVSSGEPTHDAAGDVGQAAVTEALRIVANGDERG